MRVWGTKGILTAVRSFEWLGVHCSARAHCSVRCSMLCMQYKGHHFFFQWRISADVATIDYLGPKCDDL